MWDGIYSGMGVSSFAGARRTIRLTEDRDGLIFKTPETIQNIKLSNAVNQWWTDRFNARRKREQARDRGFKRRQEEAEARLQKEKDSGPSQKRSRFVDLGRNWDSEKRMWC